MERQKKLDYNIMLIGFMGVGKSTISARLQELLPVETVEMDALIAQKAGMTIAEIFDRYGEEHFRDMETEMIKELGNQKNLLVSCGGGAVLRDENVRLMKEGGTIVLLTASPETIYERVKDSTERPILNADMSVSHIGELMASRRDKYERAADLVISTDGKNVDEICAEVIKKLPGTAE